MASEQASTFGTLLRRHRRVAGLTQEELAERANVSVYTISNFERGVLRRPHRETLELLASALGLAADEHTQFLSAGRRPMSPASPPAAAPTHRSLAHPTALIGREADLERVAGYLGDPTVRLLTLVGSPGVGKTRLAVAAADVWSNAQHHNSRFISLAEVDRADAVVETLAASLDVRQAGRRSIREEALAALRDRRELLVLDNFEHLMGAAPFVEELLSACWHLRLVVTSRVPLGLRGEQVYPVGPLAVACDPTQATDPTTLLGSPAIALFVACARRVAPDFTVTPENSPDVLAICRALDGLPLALELASAHLRFLTPSALLSRLSTDALGILRSGSGDLPPRQRTMERAIQWSYDLLTPAQQGTFRCVSVFYGGCGLDAIRAVCDASRSSDPQDALGVSGSVSANLHVPVGVGSESDALLTVETLLDHHLALRLADASGSREHLPHTPFAAFEGAAPPTTRPGEELRITVPHVMREFGSALLRRPEHAGEARAARRAHAIYYLDLAERAERGLGGPHQAYWLRRIEQDHDNFLAALEWAMRIARGDDTDLLPAAPSLALHLGAALWRFWYLRGRLREGRRWLGATQALPHPSDSVSLDVSPDARDDCSLAAACDCLKALAFDSGGDQTSRWPATGSQSDGSMGTTSVAVSSALSFGDVASCLGDYATSLAEYDACLSLRHTLGDRPDLAAALFNLPDVTPEQREFARAREIEEASLAVRREVGDHTGAAACLAHVGTLAALQRDFPQAIDYWQACVHECESLGDATNAAYARYNLGSVRLEQGDLAGAEEATSAALDALRSLGETRALAFSAFVMGQASYDNRRFWDAATRYREGLALVQSLSERATVLDGLAHLGHALLGDGYAADAARSYRESLVLARELGQRSVIATCLEGIAAILVTPVGERVSPDGAVADDRRGILASNAGSLLRAADRLRAELRTPVAPHMRTTLEQTVSAVRVAHGNDMSFMDQWSAERLLSVNDAISLALVSLAEWDRTASQSAV